MELIIKFESIHLDLDDIKEKFGITIDPNNPKPGVTEFFHLHMTTGKLHESGMVDEDPLVRYEVNGQRFSGCSRLPLTSDIETPFR